MSRRCPPDTVLVDNVCFYDCQGGYEPDLQDPFNCVQITPDAPLGFTKVPNSNSVISKPPPIAPTNNICPLGFIEWVYSQCYLKCPSNYAEGGTTCIKIAEDREYTNPSCPNLYYLPTNGTQCLLSPWGITLYVLFIVAVGALVFQLTKTTFGIGNSSTLNRIQAYLRKQNGLSSVQPKTLLSTLILILVIIAVIFVQG
jgi:hypothetical protein